MRPTRSGTDELPHTAITDLLGGDFSLAEIHRLYQCHDKILQHKRALFDHLTQRWRDLFDAKYEVLLYDLTSTCYESDPPENPADMRRFGYSHNKRSDCVAVRIGARGGGFIRTVSRGYGKMYSSFICTALICYSPGLFLHLIRKS